MKDQIITTNSAIEFAQKVVAKQAIIAFRRLVLVKANAKDQNQEVVVLAGLSPLSYETRLQYTIILEKKQGRKKREAICADICEAEHDTSPD